MAPEIALDESANLPSGCTVLDPMAGSGTVLRSASEHGHWAYGFDMDPLAVLLARVWTTPVDPDHLRTAGTELVRKAEELAADAVSLPWIDSDEETKAFVNYWFAPAQQADLRKLSSVLQHVTA